MRRPARVLLPACAAVLLAIGASGCASKRPVLYPNEKLLGVGSAAAERDIEECMALADHYVKGGGVQPETVRRVGADTATGAVVGGAAGAVGGAVGGDPARGAAVGAAAGGTAGFMGSLLGSWRSGGPDPVYANFVDRCLRQRGYEPMGWR